MTINISREPYRVPQTAKLNPLADFSSYSYIITLYILSPEAVNQFVLTNKIPLSGQGENYYIVAQSGGISEKDSRAITYNQKPGPSPGIDYYIDNLNIEIVGPMYNASPISGTEINFDIIEPIGFTFLTNLSNASDRINAASAIIQQTGNSKPNLWQQHYMLAIKFYGYNSEGEIVSDVTTSERLDRYFPIIINKVDYKLDGKPITYNISAVPMNIQSAFGAKRGIIISDISLKARTVGEALGDSGASKSSSTGLMAALNTIEAKLATSQIIQYPAEYSIEWENNDIKNKELVDQTSYDASLTAFNQTIRTSSDSNAATANATNSIIISKNEIKIKAGTPIVKAIDSIITNSTYITEKLNAENTARIAVTSVPEPNQNKTLEWFSITSSVNPIGRDSLKNDWIYKITYMVQTYKIPFLRTPYKFNSSVYHGAHKKYNYFLTGKNTEIISFEQTYDNHFYIIKPITTGLDTSSSASTAGIPAAPQGGSAGSSDGIGINRSNNIQEAVKASLSNIANQAMAEIKILGDPDLIMDSISNPRKFNSVEFNKWYGASGSSVNPMGGQVFIEIIFNLATDYDITTGTLNVSDQIKFYDDDKIKKIGIDGIVYSVTKVTSSFNRGVFTQNLDLLYVSSSLLRMPTITDPPAGRESSTSSVTGNVITIGTIRSDVVSASAAGTPQNPTQTSALSAPSYKPNDDFGPFKSFENFDDL